MARQEVFELIVRVALEGLRFDRGARGDYSSTSSQGGLEETSTRRLVTRHGSIFAHGDLLSSVVRTPTASRRRQLASLTQRKPIVPERSRLGAISRYLPCSSSR